MLLARDCVGVDTKGNIGCRSNRFDPNVKEVVVKVEITVVDLLEKIPNMMIVELEFKKL